MRILQSLLAVLATIILVDLIFPHVNHWLTAQHWVETNARLINHKFTTIESISKDSDERTYNHYENVLDVEYRYEHQGQQYGGYQLAIDGIKPDESFLVQSLEKLNSAKNTSKTISVWVNPSNPRQSVVNRDFRLRKFDFFIALFIGTAVLGYSAVIELLRNLFFSVKPRLYSRLRKRLNQNQTRRTTLHDQDTPIAPIDWGIFLLLLLPIYLGLARPALWALIDGKLIKGLVLLILSGIVLGIVNYRRTKVHAKNMSLGAVKVILEDYPVRAGATFVGFANIRTSRLPEMATVTTKIGCDQHDQRRENTRIETLWEGHNEATFIKQGRYTQARFEFDIPDHLPSAEDKRAVKINWWLELSVTSAGKEIEVKHYNDLAIFQTDPAEVASRQRRLKNNAVTKPNVLRYSTMILTNLALFLGVLVFDSSGIATLLGILIESALLALMSPLLMIERQANNSPSVQIFSLKNHYHWLVGIARVMGFVPFVAGHCVFQVIIINYLSDGQLTNSIVGKDNIWLVIEAVFITYNLWIPALAVSISMILEIIKRSTTMAISNRRQRANNSIDIETPLIRLFFTTFLMALSMAIFVNSEDGLQKLIYVILAFKTWAEFRLIKWGRLVF